jgi:hypothetical protein
MTKEKYYIKFMVYLMTLSVAPTEELHNMYSTRNIIRKIQSRRMRWVGHVAHMGEMRNGYRILVEKTRGKRPLGRPGRKWRDNTKMNLRELGLEGVDWIHMA